MSKALILIGGLLGIAGMIAAQLLALYVLYRLTLVVIACFSPMAGKKHWHKDRDRGNLPRH